MGPVVFDNVRKIRYRTGLKIPHTGIYTVLHKQHRLPHDVTLLRDETFPCCAKCKDKVQFELVMGVAEPSQFGFRITLHEIPEIESAQAAAASKEKAG